MSELIAIKDLKQVETNKQGVVQKSYFFAGEKFRIEPGDVLIYEEDYRSPVVLHKENDNCWYVLYLAYDGDIRQEYFNRMYIGIWSNYQLLFLNDCRNTAAFLEQWAQKKRESIAVKVDRVYILKEDYTRFFATSYEYSGYNIADIKAGSIISPEFNVWWDKDELGEVKATLGFVGKSVPISVRCKFEDGVPTLEAREFSW